MRILGLESNIVSMLYPFQQKGHDILACHDTRKFLKEENFHINFPNTEIVENATDLIDYKDIDIILSQPSCGKYSPLSRKDRTTYCHYNIEQYIKAINPRLFFIESKLDYIDEFTEIPGYHYHYEWVHNWGYGNTQRGRNRMWIMGVRKDQDFKFISNEKLHDNTVAKVIGDLPIYDIPEIDHIHRFNPTFKNSVTGEKYTREETFEMLKRYGKLPYIAKDGTQKHRIGHSIMRPDYSRVIAGNNPKFHWETGWPLTIREMARIQGFPDEFSFKGLSKSSKNPALCKSMPQEFIHYLVDLIDGDLVPDRPSKILAMPLKLLIRNKRMI